MQLKTLLTNAGLLGTYLLGISIVSGWSYFHAYFKSFGITIHQLESDTSAWGVTYAIYGIWALCYYFKVLLIKAIVLCSILMLVLFILLQLQKRYIPSVILDGWKSTFLSIKTKLISFWKLSGSLVAIPVIFLSLLFTYDLAIKIGQRYADFHIKNLFSAGGENYNVPAIYIHFDEEKIGKSD